MIMWTCRDKEKRHRSKTSSIFINIQSLVAFVNKSNSVYTSLVVA